MADFTTWLDGSAGPEILQPAAESALREWTVDRRVNRTGEGDDDPTIAEPLLDGRFHADLFPSVRPRLIAAGQLDGGRFEGVFKVG